MKEYIGITGYKYADEINETVKAFRKAGITQDNNLTAMIGFLVSDKQATDWTLEGRRNPSVQNLPDLLSEVPDDMMPTLHYCSRSRTLDVDNLSKILNFEYIADNTKAVQLNLDYPEAKDIQKLKERFPHLYIIQQVNPNFIGVDAAKKVMEYEGIVDKLLIDPSLGAGIAYDIRQTAELINKIYGKTRNFSYVVCGGLDAENVIGRISEAKSYVKPSFSIDAEGRLRNEDGTRLQMTAVADYISNSAKALLPPLPKIILG